MAHKKAGGSTKNGRDVQFQKKGTEQRLYVSVLPEKG